MNSRILAAALTAGTAFVATPAAAQVSGIAVTEPSLAIAASQGLQSGYAQINTTFQAQRTQIEQIQTQRQNLLRPFDKNGDSQIDEQEQATLQANTTVMTQLQGLEQQLNTLQQPITQARVYVVEQLISKYSTALQQVVTQGQIKLVLQPGTVVYMDNTVDITQRVKEELNRQAPQVLTAVPAGWQPQRQSVQLYQDVNEVLVAAAVQQAQQAQAQGQAGQPAAPPPQPVQGR